jgi:hypothetical protein
MRPATTRRLLVLGVCTLGVTSLYLAPSFGRSADQGVRGGQGPTGRPAATGTAKRVTLATADRGGPPSAGATAYPPGQSVDTVPPSVIREISFPEVRSDRLTIRWAAATDDVAVTAYRVWLDGFEVADTTGLQVSVRWFRDGSPQQVVEVRAVDAAGNQSAQALPVLITRPFAPASAAPTTSASISPRPSRGPHDQIPSPAATTTPSGRALDADG